MDLFKTQGKHVITSSESCVEISQHSGPFGQSIELNTRWRSHVVCHYLEFHWNSYLVFIVRNLWHIIFDTT